MHALQYECIAIKLQFKCNVIALSLQESYAVHANI